MRSSLPQSPENSRVCNIGVHLDNDLARRATGHEALVRLQRVLEGVHRVHDRLHFPCARIYARERAVLTPGQRRGNSPSARYFAICSKFARLCVTWTNLATAHVSTHPHKPTSTRRKREEGYALPRAARPAEEPGLEPHLPRELDERGDVKAIRLGPDGDECAAGGEVRLAVREERGVDQADGLEEDVVLWRRRVRREDLVQGRLGVVKELARTRTSGTDDEG